MRRYLLFTLCIAFNLSLGYGIDDQNQISMAWEAPRTISFGAGFSTRAISFDGAIYGDLFVGVPQFIHQEKSEQPFVKYSFEIQLPVFGVVSDTEKQILEESGFGLTEITPTQTHGRSGSEMYSGVYFFPFRKNLDTGQFEKLISFYLARSAEIDAEFFSKSTRTYPANSVLANGNWHKICVDKTGVFQLTHADLTSLGISVSSIDKANIRIFGNGGGMLPEANNQPVITDLIENAIFVSGSQSGAFGITDFILFHGQSPNQWIYDQANKVFDHRLHHYSSETCYFLTTNNGPGKRIALQPSAQETPTHQVTTFRDMAFHERELRNLLRSGKSWFGEAFESTAPLTISFDFSNIVTTEPARLKASVAARSGVDSRFSIAAGGQTLNLNIGPVSLQSIITNYANIAEEVLWFNPPQVGRVDVSVQYNRPTTSSRGFLDYISLNVSRQLSFSSPQLAFRNVNVIGPGNLARYTLANAGSQVLIWDVTDPSNVRLQQTSVVGNTLVFSRNANSLTEFVAFDGSSFHKPRLAGPVANQNLHGMQAHELVIIVNDLLLAEANRLAAFRSANDNMSVAVVTTSQVYNEFSSGVPDISALRNFIKIFYDRNPTVTNPTNKYVLLFGNGTYDNRNILGFGGNLIPTFQSQNSVNQSLCLQSDDFFVILDNHEGFDAAGLPDLGIGRLPVRNISEARAVVDKLIRYNKRFDMLHPNNQSTQGAGVVSNHADWRNKILMIADDEDWNTHINDSEEIANLISTLAPVFNVQKIYLDAYQQVILAGGQRYPDVNRAINEAINQGTLLINYIGHGGVNGLAHERIVTFDDITRWKNIYNLPVFLTATCEFSSFDNPDPAQNSAGVRIFLKPDGGASALVTSTRIAWSSFNQTFNRNFSNLAFIRGHHGRFPRLGDLIRQAKVNSGQAIQVFLKNFVLLGDPSMKMGYPELNVVTTQMPDTIRAMQNVTVSGHVTDHAGNPVNYNGILYPTVYDKKLTYTTLGQDPGSHVRDFSVQNSILFKGKVSITNGQFSFSFVVPKDIAYNFGKGKISYYFDNGSIDGHGHFSDFYVGGTHQEAVSNNQGPDIRLFMDNLSFVSGGETTPNPVLIALISDENGINTTGRLGHDILAILNENRSSPVILNNFFQYNLNSSTSGRVVFPFFNLPEGEHRLTLRAWDNHNNPSFATIDFVVSGSIGLIVEQLLNYPNPFRNNTTFSFQHNMPFTDLDLAIQIFDLGGKLVKTIETTINTPGNQSPPIEWDSKDNDGRPVANGVYVYRVRLATPKGVSTSSAKKLIVLR